MNLADEAESPPLHDLPNEELQRLINTISRNGEKKAALRLLRNKAIQLLRDRGVPVNTLLGKSNFAEA